MNQLMVSNRGCLIPNLSSNTLSSPKCNNIMGYGRHKSDYAIIIVDFVYAAI